MTAYKSVGRSHASLETATNCGYVSLQANMSIDGLFAKRQAYIVCVESRMEYYWELRSKNAQNIKALKYQLQQHLRIFKLSFNYLSFNYSTTLRN